LSEPKEALESDILAKMQPSTPRGTTDLFITSNFHVFAHLVPLRRKTFEKKSPSLAG